MMTSNADKTFGFIEKFGRKQKLEEAAVKHCLYAFF